MINQLIELCFKRRHLVWVVALLLAVYGYDIAPNGVYDANLETVVAAFQRRFRPARVDGQADRSTVDVLQRLLSADPPPANSSTRLHVDT